jgi:hypothetical protein
MARSRRSAEEAFRAQVFVRVRPVDAVTAAGDPPVLPLRFGGVEQPRVPDERYAYRPSIKATANVSSVTSTFFIRSSAAGAEMPMPGIQ